MSQIEKLKDRLFGDPIPADFTWDELTKVLMHYGYEEKQGNGSRIKFIDPAGSMPRIFIHKPHPGNIVKKKALRDVRNRINSGGDE